MRNIVQEIHDLASEEWKPCCNLRGELEWIDRHPTSYMPGQAAIVKERITERYKRQYNERKIKQIKILSEKILNPS